MYNMYLLLKFYDFCRITKEIKKNNSINIHIFKPCVEIVNIVDWGNQRFFFWKSKWRPMFLMVKYII